MTNSEQLKPDLDKAELESTIKFISECKSEGVDCTALENYIAPLLPKRVNLNDYGEITESRNNQ